MSTMPALPSIYDHPTEYSRFRVAAIQTMLKNPHMNHNQKQQLQVELNSLQQELDLSANWEGARTMKELIEYDKTLSKLVKDQFTEAVIDRLYQLKKMKIRNATLKTQIEEAEKNMFIDLDGLRMTANYGDHIGGGGGLPSSSVERAVMEPFNQLSQLRFQLGRQVVLIAVMEQALSVLNVKEQNLIELGYLTYKEELTDSEIIAELCISRGTFYTRKKTAMLKLAWALQFI